MSYRARRLSAKQKQHYLITAALSAAIVVVVKAIWPSAIPFDLFHFWKIEGSLVNAIEDSALLLVWGVSVTTVIAALTLNKPVLNRYAERNLRMGIFVSAFAGIFEEITFRWIRFYILIVAVQVMNFLFFDWAGFGVPQWIFLNIMGPVADFFTLRMLHDVLFGPYGWIVGAALIGANSEFRDGHIYQGILGWTNSWFCGMFFFWIMFHYGLPAAMFIHFLYNMLIFSVVYIDQVIERMRGYA